MGVGEPARPLVVALLPEERHRGDAFERVIAHFLRHDPTLGMRRVWTWVDWPGRHAAASQGPPPLGSIGSGTRGSSWSAGRAAVVT